MGLFKAMAVGLMLAGPVQAQDLDKGYAAFVAEDYAAALQEFRPLAEQGNVEAQYSMGAMYLDGLGVLQDYDIALKWYHLSAEQGYSAAQHALGLFYEEGRRGPQDYLDALKWYRLAAAQGDQFSWFAQLGLAAMYEKGVGVSPDNVTAHMWFNINATVGEHLAFLGIAGRDRIAKLMPYADISEAQSRARVCMASNYQDCE